MRYILFGFAALTLLAGCETAQPVQQKPNPPVRMDMMSIARNLSEGSVDVFDPSSPTLTMPAPPNQPLRTLDGQAQKSNSVRSNDPSVTIYSLDDSFSEQINEPMAMDVEPLPPLSGPDLQPPQDASPYPSPFPLPRHAK